MAQQCMTPTVHCKVGTAVYGTNSAPYRWYKRVRHQQFTYIWHSIVWHQQCTVQLAQHCIAPTVHRRFGTAVYGTNSLPTYGTANYDTKSAPYRWHNNVWHQQCTVNLAHYCMAPTVHSTDGTTMYDTNSAPYIWHIIVWHQQCTVQMAQQCMAPTVHCTYVTAMYGTNSEPYKWHSNVRHQKCTVLWCDISYSGVQLLVAEGGK